MASTDPTHPLPTKKIALIIGSTRAVRIGPAVATLIKSILDEAPKSPSFTTDLSILDLASFPLPIFDEPVIPAMVPAMAQYAHQHSKTWSDTIAAYDAYIVLSPEYNFGMPGGLKNAIDYLYHAWVGKPVLIATYGILGGANASEALTKTLGGVHLDVVEKKVLLEFPGRDAANRNMSPSLMSAMGGELHAEAVEGWGKEKRADVLAGWEELVGKFKVEGEEKA
jgi:NAD(P)H-dependent FMN reductase